MRQRAQGLNGTMLGALKLAKVEFAMVWLSVQPDMYLNATLAHELCLHIAATTRSARTARLYNPFATGTWQSPPHA